MNEMINADRQKQHEYACGGDFLLLIRTQLALERSYSRKAANFRIVIIASILRHKC